jgi:hypothetical protein
MISDAPTAAYDALARLEARLRELEAELRADAGPPPGPATTPAPGPFVAHRPRRWRAWVRRLRRRA